MPGTFTQIYIQVVFAVRNRQALIHPSWDEDLYKYIAGIIKNKGQIVYAINGVHDHIHMLIGMKPTCTLSDLVREIKKSSGSYIREKKLTTVPFHWQEGFGAFSYSHNHLDIVIRYVQNQKQHHQKQTFKQEYLELLEKYQVGFKEEYLFEWME